MRRGENDNRRVWPRVPDMVQRLFALLRRAGTHNSAISWAPDQQRTTPQERRAAQHPGHARP
jgi:hypothetical protein